MDNIVNEILLYDGNVNMSDMAPSQVDSSIANVAAAASLPMLPISSLRAADGSYHCDLCKRIFHSERGIQVHRGRAHGKFANKNNNNSNNTN
jgi:hypothetical protein